MEANRIVDEIFRAWLTLNNHDRERVKRVIEAYESVHDAKILHLADKPSTGGGTPNKPKGGTQ